MRIHRPLERYWNPFVLGWLMLLSYLQARGITRPVEGALGGNTPSRWRPASRVPPHRRATADAIIERNPFDSAAPPLRVPVPPVPPVVVANADPLSAPRCHSTQVVIVTEARAPAWSVAALRLASEPRPRDYRIGDRAADQVVEFIGYSPAQHAPTVWLSSSAGLCQTSLFVQAPPPSEPLSEPARMPQAPATAWLSHVRVVPERSQGSIVGIRLFGIGPHSLLSLIGLENGDRLEAINGFRLGTPAQALSAYAALRAAHRVALDIERRGRSLTLGYRID